MRRWLVAGTSAALMLLEARGQTKNQRLIRVPTAAPSEARASTVKDRRYGVRFEVPPGWSYHRRDGQVSTFRMDARTASRRARLRGVAHMEFNPYPESTLTGAIFYFSVEPHTNDGECTRQARSKTVAVPSRPDSRETVLERPFDTQPIGGIGFAHGHDESGGLCVEQRDEVYTAYRRGQCYRFDLAVNTFCGMSSGVPDLSDGDVEDVDARMAAILSTVGLDWSRTGPQPVHPPRLPEDAKPAERQGRLPSVEGEAP